MHFPCYSARHKELMAVFFLILPTITLAETSDIDLQKQLDDLQNQVTALNTEVQQAAEWKNPNTLVHLAGYADVGFEKSEGEDGSFVVGTFSPIFHYQYRDIIMMEAELEFKVGEDGETEVALEYMTLDWFINDYAVLVAGKFLSPIGQFRQNLHPSWINKLASAPPGFGHDGAAPLSDLGIMLRGGFPMGGIRANYAVFTTNGPELNAEAEDDGSGGIEGYELDGVAAEGFGLDRDGKKSYGGRIGIFPIPSLEIGFSAANGKATVTNVEGDATALPPGTVGPISDETARDYTVYGSDFVWFNGNMSLRGEYVNTKVGATTTGVTASNSATWQTWYTQIAYRLPNSKWEGVLRYADYDSPNSSIDQKQFALGANYLIANNFVAKLTYEFNDGQNGANSDADRTLLQLAYGF